MFPFENRPVQVVAGFLGINSSPAFSPDGSLLAAGGAAPAGERWRD